jgi:hypothetical protein
LQFPAVLPSCTAVGATTLNSNLTETSAVSCSAGWCTGGGFSFPAYFPNTTAPWQQAAASRYWRTAQLPPATDYEKEVGGVGFPDVAAIGSAHTISYFGLLTSVMGTSARCVVVVISPSPSSKRIFSLGIFFGLVTFLRREKLTYAH